MENVRRYYTNVKELLQTDNITNNIINIETLKLERESLDGIRNKLLTLPKENITQYARFIAEAVNEEIELFGYYLDKELDYDHLSYVLDLDYLYQHDYDRGYPERIASIFNRYDIAMYVHDLADEIPFDYSQPDEISLDETAHEPPIDETGDEDSYKEPDTKNIIWMERNRYIIGIKDVEIEVNKPIGKSGRNNTATALQKWVIIRNLMECASGWSLTDDENKLIYKKTDISKFVCFLCGGSEEVMRKNLEYELSRRDASVILPYLEGVGLQQIADRIKKDFLL